MKLIDTHAHVNFNAYKDDQEEVVGRSLENGIRMINVGSQFSTSVRAVEMAGKYPEGIFAAIGLHPGHLDSREFLAKIDESEIAKFQPAPEEYDKEKYRELAENPKVVAIGEIGLDYFHAKDNIDIQKRIFEEQIDLALELDLPIIVHCRDAHEDVIDILRNKKQESSGALRGVIHCFTGNLEEAKIYTEKLGFLLGFTGMITFNESFDEIIKKIDLSFLLTETDCPYLTPVPFRGKRNEPLYVEKVAEKFSSLKEISLGEVSAATVRNAEKLFDIK